MISRQRALQAACSCRLCRLTIIVILINRFICAALHWNDFMYIRIDIFYAQISEINVLSMPDKKDSQFQLILCPSEESNAQSFQERRCQQHQCLLVTACVFIKFQHPSSTLFISPPPLFPLGLQMNQTLFSLKIYRKPETLSIITNNAVQ